MVEPQPSKTTKEELEESELRYRRLFETAQDGILLVDYDTGMIVDVNPFLIDMLGYSKNDFLEKHLWEIGIFKDIVASQENFLKLQQDKYVRYEDLPLETKDGRKIAVEFVSNVYKVDGTTVIQCNVREITARKKAEDDLKDQNRELNQMNTAMIDRELKMVELKKTIKDLKEKLDKK
jgi:PAS domain S-box-containing protein